MANDYLTKPCDVAELKLKLKAAHEKRAAMLDKIQKARIDRIISHPMEAFAKDELQRQPSGRFQPTVAHHLAESGRPGYAPPSAHPD